MSIQEHQNQSILQNLRPIETMLILFRPKTLMLFSGLLFCKKNPKELSVLKTGIVILSLFFKNLIFEIFTYKMSIQNLTRFHGGFFEFEFL